MKKPLDIKKYFLIIFPFVMGFIGGFVLADATGFIPIPRTAVGAIVGGMLTLFTYEKRKSGKKFKHNEEYGSAKWGNREDILPFVDPDPKNNIVLTQTESLTMNPRPRPGKYARNKNVLVIGGSGSGKTRFFVKPNLMQCESKKYPVSFVITDPKGTILPEVGKFLKEERGYTIKVLNLIDVAKSHGYNPFSYIKTEQDILTFVTALIQNTKGESKGGDDFWVKAETLLYQALIGYIIYELPPPDRNVITLRSMLNAMEVHEDDESYKNAVDFLFDELEFGDEEKGIKPKPEHFAVEQYRAYKLAAGKTAKSILISCAARLSPFSIKEVRELMRNDELELDKLGGYKTASGKTVKRKTALFVMISDTNPTYNFIVGLMYSQLFNLLCDLAITDFEDDGGRLPVHVRFLLDEFANIGLIPNFEKLIATFRSREISAAVILQTLSQLKAIYKDNMETIVGNCDTTLFLGGKEKSTLKELEEILGKETVHMYNTSVTRGNQESHGQNYQKVGRSLMSTDEIAIMDGEKCILQVRGARPFFSKKFDIEKHPNYKYLSDADKANKFNVAEYLAPFKKSREALLRGIDPKNAKHFSVDMTQENSETSRPEIKRRAPVVTSSQSETKLPEEAAQEEGAIEETQNAVEESVTQDAATDDESITEVNNDVSTDDETATDFDESDTIPI